MVTKDMHGIRAEGSQSIVIPNAAIKGKSGWCCI